MNQHMYALCISFSICLFLFWSLQGWGRLTSALLKIETTSRFADVWLGFASVLFVVQIVHIWFSIHILMSFPLLLLGGFYSVCLPNSRHKNDAHIARRSGYRTCYAVYGILLFAYALWVCSRCMLPPKIYDSGSYHFNAIRWLNELPLVPGLGNLHGRLAFNQSFFSFVALLNLFPYFNRGHNIANAFLMIVVVAECFYDGLCFFARMFDSERWRQSGLVSLFLLPPLLYYSLNAKISSPSPDTSIFLIQIVLLQYVLKLIECRDDEQQMATLKFLLIMSVWAITCKLSIIGYACAVCLTAALHLRLWRKPPRNLFKEMRLTLMFCLLVLGVWAGRGIAQSGAPMYPSTFLRINADWAVPAEKMQDEANWIYSWARQPGKHWNEVLGTWDWLLPWTTALFEDDEIAYPLKLWMGSGSCVLAIACLTRRKKRSTTHRNNENWLASLPIAGGIAFWFFTAPDPRFALGLFWLSGMLSLSALCLAFQSNLARAACLISCGCVLIWPVWQQRQRFADISSTGYQPIPKAELTIQQTDSGLNVYIPISGGQCWNSPLPATPYFNPKLRLRGESLQDGFSVIAP